MMHGHVTVRHCNFARSRDLATLQCRIVDCRHVHHSIMINVSHVTTFRLAVGHATVCGLRASVYVRMCEFADLVSSAARGSTKISDGLSNCSSVVLATSPTV